MTESTPDKVPYVNVSLVFDEETDWLKAELTHAQDDPGLDWAGLQQLVVDKGFQHFAIANARLEEVLRAVQKGEETVIDLAQKPEYTALALSYDEESRQLKATLSSSDEDPGITWAGLQDLIRDNGYENCQVTGAVLKQLLTKIENAERGTFVLGKKPEFTRVELQYDEGSRQLTAELSLSEEDLGVNEESLQAMITEGGYDNYLSSDSVIEELAKKVRNNERGSVPLGEKPQYSLVELKFDEASAKLQAELSPTDIATHHSLESLQAQIDAAGYQDLFFAEKALESLLKHIKQKEWGVSELASRLDAEVSLEVAVDKMSAFLTVTQAYGGEPVSIKQIKSAIAREGLSQEFVNQSVIEQVVADGSAVRRPLAQARDAKKGLDATFEALVTDVIYHAPAMDEDGNVDHHEIKDFVVVEEGQALMRRTPATEGDNGCDVYGDVILAESGEDTPFDEDLEGVAVDSEDSNLLVAITKGHPVLMPTGVKIDKTLKVVNVNGRTGNITFDGSVLVTGDIDAGMEVHATGDIHVKGVIAHSLIEADGDITVAGGVIGGHVSDDALIKESEDDVADQAEMLTATLKAGGSIQVKYISLANVVAGKNIEVKEYASHCVLTTQEQILLGQPSGKGVLMGGSCNARMGVVANSLGNDAGIRTTIKVGAGAELQNKHDNLNNTKRKIQAEVKTYNAELRDIIQSGQEGGLSDARKKRGQWLSETLKTIRQDYAVLMDELNAARADLKAFQEVAVEARKQVFGNVYLQINTVEFIVRVDSKGGRFVREGKTVKWES